MQQISDKERQEKIKLENPWWIDGAIDADHRSMTPRAYLPDFLNLVLEAGARRAVVLMGPRRVGKTILLYHAIQQLIEQGVRPRNICYLSIEAPVYSGCRLEHLVELYAQMAESPKLENCFIFFDEIQYLRGWEVHLKRLVDDYGKTRFVASGSAAAALKLKSTESGAGRFTDFYLPPLTFYEYLLLLRKNNLIEWPRHPGDMATGWGVSANIATLNQEFVNYLNFGGYPEALFSKAIQANPQRFIKSDIVDKVLLKDLPNLYGIQDIQELNRLFTVLAYNTGNEVSLDGLSSGAGVAKNTLKKYIEYLQAAFLIIVLHRLDDAGRRFRRANYFKVYLTNPSMRSALFHPINSEHPFMGNMVETAILSQWTHSSGLENLFYARCKHEGEVDLVWRDTEKVRWCVEVKWTNRFHERPYELSTLLNFARKNKIHSVAVTTVDQRGEMAEADLKIRFVESSVYCWTVGYNLLRSRKPPVDGQIELPLQPP
ncbi:MAG: ATP-binding protein [Nitrospirae bacterium]|nr:ATP-binding protein [Nitrospirota bacterium]